MAAGKHHSELVILDLLFKGWRFHWQLLPKPQKVCKLRDKVAELIVTPEEVDGAIARHPHEPGRRVVGKALNRPRFQGPAKGILDHVLGKFEAAKAENPG